MALKMVLHRVFSKGCLCLELPDDPVLMEKIKDMLMLCRDRYGDYMSITIDKPARPRSTGKDSQNHKLNAMIMELCRHTGNSYDMVKYCVKMKAVEELGYPYEEMDGHILPKGEHESTVEECSLLIEAAYLLASDLHIVLEG
jgi:hypothetical protein